MARELKAGPTVMVVDLAERVAVERLRGCPGGGGGELGGGNVGGGRHAPQHGRRNELTSSRVISQGRDINKATGSPAKKDAMPSIVFTVGLGNSARSGVIPRGGTSSALLRTNSPSSSGCF